MRIALSLLIALASLQALASSDKLAVHEWGTFTYFHDENGKSIAGLNVDDEPLPPFVQTIPISNEQSSKFSKAIPRLHPQVTMRLETPVVYFYPPENATLPMTVSFSATFNGGLLTQFFPKADVSKIDRTAKNLVRIEPTSAGSLTWRDVKVGTRGKLEETKEPVWTAPRDVQAAMLTAADGMSEKFLFYRGVGNLDAPVKVTRADGKIFVRSTSDRQDYQPDAEQMYLAQIRTDGSCAFHRFRQGDGINLKLHEATADHFADKDFAPNVDRLRTAMHESLVQAGLKDDEATAMLKTWEQSYFKSAGTRLFFIVPPAWTNDVLPITVSPNAEITRVMVGRVELVTPEMREAIATINRLRDFKDKGTALAYGGLGRFRDALLLDAAKTDPGLAAFLKGHGIKFAEWSDQPVAMIAPTDRLSRGASPAAK
jgi:hypothetical protein